MVLLDCNKANLGGYPVRKYLLSGVALLAVWTSASASELVWRGKEPSRQVLGGVQMTPRGSCYPTVRRLQGKLYFHEAECREKIRPHLDIGMPLDGPPIKMPHEARSFSVDKNGWIVLK